MNNVLSPMLNCFVLKQEIPILTSGDLVGGLEELDKVWCRDHLVLSSQSLPFLDVEH